MIYFFSKLIIFILCLLLSNNATSQVLNDTLQLNINEHNTIYITTVLNEKDTLVLNFDTGCTDLILTSDVLKNKLNNSINLYHTNYSLQIGKSIFNTKIYDAELTGHGTEGRFGWNFYEDKTIELNYDKNIMVVHNKLPNVIINDSSYSKLPITIIKGLPFIEAEIKQGNKILKEYFLFDTGYQRTAMLDNDELKNNNFPTDKMKEIKRVIMYGGQGNEIPVITSELESLKIGKFDLENVPVQQITENKPMYNYNAHILGNEVLKRFNVFMDYRNGFIYIKPNHFISENYIDTKKA